MFTIFLDDPTVNYIDVLFYELHKDVLNFLSKQQVINYYLDKLME